MMRVLPQSHRPVPFAVAPRAAPLPRHARLIGHAAEVDEIDPTTGQAYPNPQVRQRFPSESVEAGGIKWAYRKSAGGDSSKQQILLLHGIGSNSYQYRDLMRLLSLSGHDCYAPDWVGHGASDKPGSFGYDEKAYVDALEQFVQAVSLTGPYAVVTHGFVLGQYGLLWALKHSEDISHLVILGTPLGINTPLRPELAQYKNPVPFLRPKPDAKFAGDLFNAAGLAYVISYDDAQVYDRCYQEEPAANEAVFKTMQQLDWKVLLQKVDEGYRPWRVPSAVLYGNKDEFLDIRGAVAFLDSKRTCMQLASIEGKLGHCPQEDFADAFAPVVADFFADEDISVKGTKKFRKFDTVEKSVVAAGIQSGNMLDS